MSNFYSMAGANAFSRCGNILDDYLLELAALRRGASAPRMSNP
jgi:hypothetical protein